MIDPSVRAVLRSPYTIRRFFLLYGGVLLGAVIALWAFAAGLDANSTLRLVAISFLGNFAAAVAIFILTYGLYVFVTPPGLRDAQVVPLRSGEIADEIIDLRIVASDYWFWGRSGSYFRSTVLPKLDEAARKERRHIEVRIVVPDPDGNGNAARYALMKQGLGEDADENTLRANVVATVVSAVTVAARNPYLHVSIGLCATVPVLRHDISTAAALITRDAINLPAILVNAGNPYFEMFRDAVENELRQARRITWDQSAHVFAASGPISVEGVLQAIDGLGEVDPTIATVAEQLIASKAHRYARASRFESIGERVLSVISRDAR